MTQKEHMLREYEVMRWKYAGMPEEVVQKAGDIALLSLGDIYHIFCHAAALPDGARYVEIGSHIGGSLVIVEEARKFSKKEFLIHAIEPVVAGIRYAPELEQRFRKNTEHIDMTMDMRYSADAVEDLPDQSIDLLFIDGNHSYLAVKDDIIRYWPKVKMEGVMLGHDFNSGVEGMNVVKAVLEVCMMQEVSKLSYSNIFKVKKERRNVSLFVRGN